MKRREFINKASVGMGSFAAMQMCDILDIQDAEALSTSGGMGIEEACSIVDAGKEKNTAPSLRPEIMNNPRAVFIIETNVDAKKDESGHFTEASPQLEAEGKRTSDLIFVKGDKKGGSTFIKPNFTMVLEHCYNRTTGVYSSPDYVVGMVEHLREIGNTNIMTGQTASPAVNHRRGRIYDAFDPKNIPMCEPGYKRWTDYKKNELNIKKVKDSLIWKQIPYFRPIGDEDNFLINVGTLKCHLTAITTLAIKNFQGAVARGLGQFCTAWSDVEMRAYRDGVDFNKFYRKDYYQRVEESFLKHRAAGYKRWDPTGSYTRYEKKGGWDVFKKAKKNPADHKEFMEGIGSLMRHETWLQRGLDNIETLRPDINIIEGIIGLDGEELNRNAIGDDTLVNVVLACVSPYELDAIGSYVMGHDPREIWYTRAAKERGLGECDPSKIDVYKIKADGEVIKVKDLSEIKRTPLGLNWSRKDDPNERLFW